jgi:hypothetical protein
MGPSRRKLGHWGHSLEGYKGILAYSFLISELHRWAASSACATAWYAALLQAQKQWCQLTIDWNLQNCKPKLTFPLFNLITSDMCYSNGSLTNTVGQNQSLVFIVPPSAMVSEVGPMISWAIFPSEASTEVLEDTSFCNRSPLLLELFSNLSTCQNYLEDLGKCRLLGPTPRGSDVAALGRGPRICPGKSGVAGHFDKCFTWAFTQLPFLIGGSFISKIIFPGKVKNQKEIFLPDS